MTSPEALKHDDDVVIDLTGGGARSYEHEPPPSPTGWPRWWALAVLALLVAGLVLRLAFAMVWATPLGYSPGDERYYQHVGQSVAEGHGYVDDLLGASGPSTSHPPAFVLVIAGLDRLGLGPSDNHGSDEPQRVALALITASAIPLAALLGRRLAGPAVGVVTAGIVAVHPLWVQNGPNLWPEGIYLVVVVLLLLLAVRMIDRPSWPRAVLLGVAVGACALTRSEGIAFLVVVGLPAAIAAGHRWRQRLRLGGLVVLATLVTVAPWLIRNYTIVHTVTFSTQDGMTVAGANCDQTYAGDRLGGFTFDCAVRASLAANVRYGRAPDADAMSSHLESVAGDYVGDHPASLPKVVGARVLRAWSLFHTGDELAWSVQERRNRTFQTVGQYLEWVLLPLAVAGAALLPRPAWRRWIVVAAGPVLVTVVVALLYGSVRLRAAAEPSVALFAAFGIVTLVARLAGRRPQRWTPSPAERA
ncbi:MAG: ArnT family glycosyltransferase [Acidimicrobiales bacterium]